MPMKSLVHTTELCSWSVPLEHAPGAKSLVCIGLIQFSLSRCPFVSLRSRRRMGQGKGREKQDWIRESSRRSSLSMPYTGNWSSHPKNVILPETVAGNPELIHLLICAQIMATKIRQHSQMFVYCLCLSLSLKVGVKRKKTTAQLCRYVGYNVSSVVRAR